MTPYELNDPFAIDPLGKSRGIFALLAIFLGGLGVQYFYLGKIKGGVIWLIINLVTCGLASIVTLIQGILAFCMTNQQFTQKYVTNPAVLPLF